MEDGLARLGSFRPDVIVVDLMMEHYDTGFVFSKKIREQPGLEGVPVIMQTAASKEVGFTFDASDPKARRWMKVDEVLIKPVPLDILEGRIRNALSRRDADARRAGDIRGEHAPGKEAEA
jgi:DNA-binding response OmpR family regulator